MSSSPSEHVGRPTLSVVMANYNHAKVIARALDALMAQSRLPDEVIVVDDASTDNSIAVVEEYARHHPRIRLLRNTKNMGANASFNRGFDACRGDYVYYAAADDRVLPGFFEEALSMAAAHPAAGIIFGNMVVFDAQGNELNVLRPSCWTERIHAAPATFLKEYIEVVTPATSFCGATIYRSAAVREMGGYREELLAWADTFLARCIGLKYGCCYIPHPCMAWHIDPNSFSQSLRSNVYDQLDIVIRAAFLMRSERFRDIFPAAHVDLWQWRYRDQIISERVRRFSEDLLRLKNDLQPRKGEHDPICRLVLPFINKLLGALRRVSVRLLERKLWRYKGDLSCYDRTSRQTPAAKSDS